MSCTVLSAINIRALLLSRRTNWVECYFNYILQHRNIITGQKSREWRLARSRGGAAGASASGHHSLMDINLEPWAQTERKGRTLHSIVLLLVCVCCAGNKQQCLTWSRRRWTTGTVVGDDIKWEFRMDRRTEQVKLHTNLLLFGQPHSRTRDQPVNEEQRRVSSQQQVSQPSSSICA